MALIGIYSVSQAQGVASVAVCLNWGPLGTTPPADGCLDATDALRQANHVAVSVGAADALAAAGGSKLAAFAYVAQAALAAGAQAFAARQTVQSIVGQERAV